MGTVVSFHVAPDGAQAHEAVRRACARIHALEAELTTWDPASAMSRVRDGTLDLADAPSSIQVVLERCEEVRELSAGWFDPWALPGGTDPTGLAKGWILEEALAELRVDGVRTAIVNGGGDVCMMGSPDSKARGWRIGVQHPWRANAFACVLEVTGAIATSGAYQRGLHLFNPRTHLLCTAAASATVVGPDLATADGLATALAVGGDDVLDRIERLGGYDGYLIREDGSEAQTSGIVVVQDHAAMPTQRR